MTADRTLSDYSDDELLAEIDRRRVEAQRRLDRLTAAAGGPVKMAAKSEAKRAYWADYRKYRESHPDASVTQWRRAAKRGKG